ncbi:MAG: IS66 family transposase [Sulfitobacter sp.]
MAQEADGRRAGLGLTRFLEDGRLELDTNPVENQIGQTALTHKRGLMPESAESYVWNGMQN